MTSPRRPPRSRPTGPARPVGSAPPGGRAPAADPTGDIAASRASGAALVRSIGAFRATVVGLAAMLGAGVFVVWQPAAQAAGWWLLAGLAIAAVVATLNALSSAQLASVFPRSGGAYLYGRELIGPHWGFTAGWLFLAGKTASAGAMALVLGGYLWPDAARPIAGVVVIAATVVSIRGVRLTAAVSAVLVSVTLLTLLVVATVGFVRGPVDSGAISAVVGGDAASGGPGGILTAAGLLFFAFAGYARIATLSEEVTRPARTLPIAVLSALSIALVVYALVAVVVLTSIGPDAAAASPMPLTLVVGGTAADVVLRIVAALASAGALLGVLAGLSRTSLAMAREGDLPGPIAAVSPRTKGPVVAELVIGGVVLLSVVTLEPTGLIGFSSCAVLLYYAIAQLSAIRLGRLALGAGPLALRAGQRWLPRFVPYLGLAGCVLLAVTLPWASVTTTAVLLALGLIVRAVTRG